MTADVCLSSHPYCVTDNLSGKERKKKKAPSVRTTREKGNVTHLSGAKEGKKRKKEKRLDANFS